MPRGVALGDIVSRSDLVFERYKDYADGDPEKPTLKQLKKGKGAFDNVLGVIQENVSKMQERAAALSAPDGPKGPERASQKSQLRKECEALLAPANSATQAQDGDAPPTIADLRKLIRKGAEDEATVRSRTETVESLVAAVHEVQADAGMAPRNRLRPGGNSAAGPSSSRAAPSVRAPDFKGLQPGAYAHTEESKAFEQEWHSAKAKQDKQLDRIEMGVDTLKNIAHEMGDEMTAQDPLVDHIEVQMDDNIDLLRNNNRRMAHQLKQVASTRNFCIDVTLVLILLAIGGYIYSVLK